MLVDLYLYILVSVANFNSTKTYSQLFVTSLHVQFTCFLTNTGSSPPKFSSCFGFLPPKISATSSPSTTPHRRDFEDVDVVSLSAAMNLFAKVLQWHRAIHLLALSPQEARFRLVGCSDPAKRKNKLRVGEGSFFVGQMRCQLIFMKTQNGDGKMVEHFQPWFLQISIVQEVVHVFFWVVVSKYFQFSPLSVEDTHFDYIYIIFFSIRLVQPPP